MRFTYEQTGNKQSISGRISFSVMKVCAHSVWLLLFELICTDGAYFNMRSILWTANCWKVVWSLLAIIFNLYCSFESYFIYHSKTQNNRSHGKVILVSEFLMSADSLTVRSKVKALSRVLCHSANSESLTFKESPELVLWSKAHLNWLIMSK